MGALLPGAGAGKVFGGSLAGERSSPHGGEFPKVKLCLSGKRGGPVSSLAALEQPATIISCGASFVAAILWFYAARTNVPPFPDVGLDSDSSVFEPVRSALRKANRRNASAALSSAIAALAYAVALLS